MRFRLFQKTIMVLGFLCISIAAAAQARKAELPTPDFAYPKTVATNAEKDLGIALKTGNDIAALRAMMDFGLAQGQTGKENLPDVVNKVKNLSQQLSTPEGQALAELLLANIYNSIFEADKYVYNRRELPATPLPDDYTQWSGDQFRNEIFRLCKEALSKEADLKRMPLRNFESIITCDQASAIYFPTLFDFAAHNSISLLSSLTPFSSPSLGIISLSPKALFMVTPVIAAGSPETQEIMNIYGDLLRFHSSNQAAGIYCDIQRLLFASNHLYSNLYNQKDRELISRLYDIYTSNMSSEFSGNALIALGNLITLESDKYSPVSAKTFYKTLKKFASFHPNFARLGCINNLIDQLSSPSVAVTAPQTVSPGHEFRVKISSENRNRIKLAVYRIPDKTANANINNYSLTFNASKLKGLTPVKTVEVALEGSIPFTADTTVSISVPDYGYYVVIDEKSIAPNDMVSGIRSTSLAIGSINSEAGTDLFVIDPLTGAPVGKASIAFSKGTKNPSLTTIGQTDNEGFYRINKDSGRTYHPVNGRDKYAASIYGSYYIETEQEWSYRTNSYTDLPLYRPGDTVRWCAVIYQVKGLERKLSAASQCKAILYNANNNPVDTVRTTSDGWGRINGSFVIPDNELTGDYRIQYVFDDNNINTHYFKVSDYKMPTFFLSLDKAANGIPSEGDVTISGTVKTYSGVSLGGIPVSAVMSASVGRWWFRSNSVNFCTLRDTTDAEGKFRLVLTKEAIANSPAPEGVFTALVQATSASGESQQNSTEFCVGNTYTIVSKLPSTVILSTPFDMSGYLDVKNGEGESVVTKMGFILTDTRDPRNELKGTVGRSVTFGDLPASVYSMKVFTTDLKADTLDASLTLYEPSGKTSPVDAPLWSPANKLSISDNNMCEAEISSSADDLSVLYLLYSNNTVLERKWLKLHKGANNVRVKLPADLNNAQLNLSAAKNFRQSTLSFDIERLLARRTLAIKAESFRDRITPGDLETWTFSTINADSKGEEAALIFDMYNSALKSLNRVEKTIAFSKGYVQSVAVRRPAIERFASNTSHKTFDRSDNCTNISDPRFNTYGLSFVPVMKRVTEMLYAKSRSAMAVASDVMEESVDVKAMGTGNSMNAAADSDGGIAESETEAENGSTASEASHSAEPELREGETTLAFFDPTLTTGADGQVSFSFKVPNANTTWDFTALAYDRDLTTAEFNRQILANKPLMVTPNLPRFLRTGDRVSIAATVFNNSEEDQSPVVTVEFFNPADDTVIFKKSFAKTKIEAGKTLTLSTELAAPANTPLLGYRIVAETELLSDGEQSLIPILEASAPVVETTPFYINPDSTSFSMKLPSYPSGSQITLQFCDNPIWYVVTALPGISASTARTAPEAAASLFSTAVAEGILKTVPEVKHALQQWTASDQSDSTLVSMLEQNQDLKTILLKATPWMLDAKNDTERMTRLAMLFDTKNIRKTYSENISLLGKLQRADGGFAWMNQSTESSEWATYRALVTIGRLNALGFQPTDKKLSAIIQKALGYYQICVEKSYRKYPKSDFTSFVTVTDLYPSFALSLTGKEIVAKNVQQQLSGWKKMSLPAKVDAAKILFKHGYSRNALEILESLRQYSQKTPTQGMWWPILSDLAGGTMTELNLTAQALWAFCLISPQSDEIDAIRQWLILQKESREWGNSPEASEVCAAVLLSSPKWISSAKAVEVTVGSKTVSQSPTDRTLGYFRTDISDLSPAGKMLAIEKSDRTPAWGAVYSRSIRTLADTEASACDAVSIRKRFLKQAGDKWVETTTANVGDKLRIELLVKCNRAMDYVAITDDRAACLEPVEQLPTPVFAEGLCFYRENNDASTNLFISNLGKGTYLLTYEVWVNNAGSFASGIATIQSQYAPQLSAHSAGTQLVVGKP